MHARLTIDLDWPYDDAVVAMQRARDQVIAGGEMHVFVGSHREEVVTLGRHAPSAQLVHRAAIDARGAIVRRIERGGGATAHGPGQLVVYPVIHLERCGLDVVTLTRALLEACVDTASEIGVQSTAAVDPAGVFVDGAKLASIGMRVEHGVVTHGIALNVSNDLSLFDLIAPCGVSGQRMASLSSLRGVQRVSQGDLLLSASRRLAFHVGRRCVLAWSTQLAVGNEGNARVSDGDNAGGGRSDGSGTGAHA